MATYQVNQEGVDALKSLSRGLIESLDMVEAAMSRLQAVCNSQNGRGPNADKIDSVIMDIHTIARNAEGPIQDLSERVSEVAEAYQDIIDNDPYSGIM